MCYTGPAFLGSHPTPFHSHSTIARQAFMTSASDVKYLIFDVESVADGELISRVKFSDDELTSDEAIARFRAELVESGGRDFIPYTYQIPVAVVIAKVTAEFELVDLVSLDEPHFRAPNMTDQFWRGWEAYRRPTWVTFNGRCFDLPLMELAAFRYGIALPGWFDNSTRGYEQNRNRFNTKSHLDLHELLTNFGATWFRGGLNLAANLLGKPGKMNLQGDLVQDYYSDGRLQEISDYCRCDVLDTFFVFLRCQLLMGKLNLSREQEIVENTYAWLQERKEDCDAFARYLDCWGDWENPWESSKKLF